jgi:hypothetical protein
MPDPPTFSRLPLPPFTTPVRFLAGVSMAMRPHGVALLPRDAALRVPYSRYLHTSFFSVLES